MDLVLHPSPSLRRKSVEVVAFDSGLRDLVGAMRRTMARSNGIGLAAVQVGVHSRVALVRVGSEGILALVNPEVIEASDEVLEREEGCLSLPGVRASVVRPARVKVSYVDVVGERHEIFADGLTARCMQHEIDHMDGKLFLDLLAPPVRLEAYRRYASQPIPGYGRNFVPDLARGTKP